MSKAQDFGRAGEALARLYLETCGFACVAARQRARGGEIDLIVRRGDLVVFVEVKARRGEGWGRPEAAVDARKLGHLRRAAAAWIVGGGAPGAAVFRFDVVAVSFWGEGRGCRIEHFAGVSVGGRRA